MHQSSSGSTSSENKQNNKSNKADAFDETDESAESGHQRLITDRLLAALASGNLDNLAQARKAFLKQDSADAERDRVRDFHPAPGEPGKKMPHSASEAPFDLEGKLERRSTGRLDQSSRRVDDLRLEEEDLRRAEAELERRRTEVLAAKRKAEEEAKRKAFEENRLQLEIEARRRSEEEEARLTDLQRLRDA